MIPVELFLGTGLVANETTLFSLGTFGEFGFCDSQIDVLDISDPEPERISQILPGSCVMDLALEGDYLYTAGRNGMKLFNISDPEAIKEVALFSNPNGFHGVEAVAVKEEVTYLLTGEGGGAEVRLIDLSVVPAEHVSEPLVVGSTVLLDLFVQVETLIVPQWQGGLFIIDVSNEKLPQLLSSPEEGQMATGDIFSMGLNGSAAYVPLVDGVLIGGVAALDMSDPNNPIIASTVETGDYQVMHMVGGNEYLYVLAQGEAFNIHIFDVSDPLTLVALGTVSMPEPTNRLAVVDDTLFSACDRWNCQSLYAIDVSDPSSAWITGKWQMEIGAADLIPAGEGFFFLTTFEQGIWLLNVTDPTNPYLAGRIQLPGDFAQLKIVDGIVYAAAFDAGLYILSID